ncbi:MAG: hypothetical protein LRS46_00765 [Desulfurococcales archaeon]|nr:hypothetical protein [Desulfurococcales archaeon]
MGSLAEQYYEAAWRAVREGPKVVEELYGPSIVFEQCYRKARNSSFSVAERFFTVACYMAVKLAREIIDAMLEDEEFCGYAGSYLEEVRILYLKLKRDTLDEAAEYGIHPGEAEVNLALNGLEALKNIVETARSYCLYSETGH